jgi:ABC-type branched-subunit amino acid transport system substrate-binding protein
MRIRRKVSMLVLMLFMLSIVAGCSQGGDNGAAQQEGDTIKVGINTELSGPVASYGSNAANGALLAIEEINAAGGVLGKQLDPLSRDCKSIPDEAMSVSAALVGEKIVAQIGPLTSGNVAGSTPVMMENQIPLLAPAATAVNVTVDEKTNKVRDFIFRVCYRDSDQGQRMANFALEDLNVKNAAIYGSTSDDYATGLAKYFKEEFTSKGGTIVAEEGFVNGDKDFRATLTKIKSADPEFIYVPGYYTEVAVLIKQALEAVEMVEADGLQLHFNIPQELAMPEGDRDFAGMLENVARLVENSPVPIIAKEVGFGFSQEAARRLCGVGINYFDVGGKGGTNFVAIEDRREGWFVHEFDEWGIPTAVSLGELLALEYPITLIATGGIRTALDGVKALAVGASLIGMAGPLLKILVNEGEAVLQRYLQGFLYRLKAGLLMTGSRNIGELQQKPVIILGKTAQWLTIRSIDVKRWAAR